MSAEAPGAPYHRWIAKLGGRRFVLMSTLFLVTSSMRFAPFWGALISPDLAVIEVLSDTSYTAITIAIAGTYITGTSLAKFATVKALMGRTDVARMAGAVDDSGEMRTLEENSGLSEVSDYTTGDRP